MPIIRFTTRIHAPIECCFDLARSIDFHVRSMSRSGEAAIAGVTTGLISHGQEVTWRAKHFGVWQTLTSRITEYDRPRHFRDSMVRGAFRRFDHDHHFRPDGDWTAMEDVFDYAAPLWLLGRIAEVAFLNRYLRNMLTDRANQIKAAAESGEWRGFLGAAHP